MTQTPIARPLILPSIVIACILAGFAVPRIMAAGLVPITGWAWSSNIGWISFSGSGYSVYEDTATGALSGWAWSSNIGWISFNALDVSGCPSGTCAPKIDLSTGKVSGWVRSCAAFANKSACGGTLDGNSNGWDGWISLSGTATDGSLYGINQNVSCVWTGYAWGSDAIVAISMSGVAEDGSSYGVTGTNTAACAIVCAEGQAYVGGVCVACDNDGCTGGGGTSTHPLGPPGNPIVCINGANNPPLCSQCPNGRAYVGQSCVECGILGCTGSGGTPSNPFGSLTCIDGANNPIGCNTCTSPLVWNGSNACIPPPDPTVTISVNPDRVNPLTQNNTTIAWSSEDAISCTIVKNPTSSGWPKTGTNSTGIQDTVTVQTTYAIDCANDYGAHSNATTTVNTTSVFQEF